MGSAPVTKDGMVCLRGIYFPAENIRAVMLETGGKPVSDQELNNLLDRAMVGSIASGVEKPEALEVEAIPDMWFVPIKINLHIAPGNVPSGGWLYFAVAKRLIFNA